MDIELLTVPSCPNRRMMVDRLGAALRELGLPRTRVTERIISDQDEARTAGMRGSPTVLLDGHDPFDTPDAGPSLSCRLYRSAGGLEGAPSVDQLVVALSRHPKGEVDDV